MKLGVLCARAEIYMPIAVRVYRFIGHEGRERSVQGSAETGILSFDLSSYPCEINCQIHDIRTYPPLLPSFQFPQSLHRHPLFHFSLSTSTLPFPSAPLKKPSSHSFFPFQSQSHSLSPPSPIRPPSSSHSQHPNPTFQHAHVNFLLDNLSISYHDLIVIKHERA